MPPPFRWLADVFGTAGFMPRSVCGAWHPALRLAYISGQAAIATAYVLIPLALLHIWRRKRGEMARPEILLQFAAFIFLCGLTHVCDIVVFWWPAYRLFTALLVATGAYSLRTAWHLRGVLPYLLALPSWEKVHALNVRLRREIAEKEAILAAEKERGDRACQKVVELSHLVKTKAWVAKSERDLDEITRQVDEIKASIRGTD